MNSSFETQCQLDCWFRERQSQEKSQKIRSSHNLHSRWRQCCPSLPLLTDNRRSRKNSFLPSAPFCCTALDVLRLEGRLWSTFLLHWTSGGAYLLQTHFKMGDRKERWFNVIAYLYGFIFQKISLCKVISQISPDLSWFLLFFLICHVYKVPICSFLVFLMMFLYNVAEFRAECYHIRMRELIICL